MQNHITWEQCKLDVLYVRNKATYHVLRLQVGEVIFLLVQEVLDFLLVDFNFRLVSLF